MIIKRTSRFYSSSHVLNLVNSPFRISAINIHGQTKLIFSYSNRTGPIENPNRFTVPTLTAVSDMYTCIRGEIYYQSKCELLPLLPLNNSSARWHREGVGHILDMNFILTANFTFNELWSGTIVGIISYLPLRIGGSYCSPRLNVKRYWDFTMLILDFEWYSVWKILISLLTQIPNTWSRSW